MNITNQKISLLAKMWGCLQPKEKRLATKENFELLKDSMTDLKRLQMIKGIVDEWSHDLQEKSEGDYYMDKIERVLIEKVASGDEK